MMAWRCILFDMLVWSAIASLVVGQPDSGDLCPPLQAPRNTEINYIHQINSSIALNTVAMYRCNIGTLIGCVVRACQTDGTWTGEDPNCQLADCGSLRSPPNGIVDMSSGTSEGSIVSYSCTYGYYIRHGPVTRTCGSGGMWTHDVPTCQFIYCPPPPPVSNAFSGIPTNISVGGTVTYSCDPGYVFSGSTLITCLSDGTWSTPYPTCQLPPMYVSLSSTYYASNNSEIEITSIGEHVEQSLVCHTDHYYCCRAVDGYYGPYYYGMGIGEWTFPDGTNVTARSQRFANMSTTIVRSRGHRVIKLHRIGSIGSPTGTYCCVIPSYFYSEATFCVELVEGITTTPPSTVLKCTDLNGLSNGVVTHISGSSNARPINSSVTYQCNMGYFQRGGNVRTCQSDGTWSGTEPVCLVDCGPPLSVSNGSPGIPNSTLVGGTVVYSCNRGYFTLESTTVTCLATGSWSKQPSCTKSPPLYLSFSSTYYATSITNITLLSVGEGSNDSLTCHFESGVGNWYFPNSSVVQASRASGMIYITRDSPFSVSLNRENAAVGPTGFYCCVTTSSAREHIRCAYMSSIHVLESTESTDSHTQSSSIPSMTCNSQTEIVIGAVIGAVTIVLAIAISVVLIACLVLKLRVRKVDSYNLNLKSSPPTLALEDKGQTTSDIDGVAYEEVGPSHANYTQCQAYVPTERGRETLAGNGDDPLYDN